MTLGDDDIADWFKAELEKQQRRKEQQPHILSSVLPNINQYLDIPSQGAPNGANKKFANPYQSSSSRSETESEQEEELKSPKIYQVKALVPDMLKYLATDEQFNYKSVSKLMTPELPMLKEKELHEYWKESVGLCNWRHTEVVRLKALGRMKSVLRHANKKNIKLDMQVTNGNNFKSWIIAIDENDFELLQMLLTNGLQADDKDRYGDTPLRYLMWNINNYNSDARIKMVNLLIEKRAELNAVNNYGSTALMILMLRIKNSNFDACMNIFKLFLQNGANLNAVNEDGEDVWFYINRIRNNELKEKVRSEVTRMIAELNE